MGGTTFIHAAQRMSSDTLDALTAYCTDRLSSVLPSIERMHHVGSKKDHGDLDLVCAMPFDVPIRRQDVGMTGQSTPPTGSNFHNVTRLDEQTGKEQPDRCREFAEAIATRLAASEWMVAYYGYPLIAVKIPCHLITLSATTEREASAVESASDAFYQVDLGHIPPASFEWYRVLTSYSIPYAALVLAGQTLSPAIWLRRDALTLRHSPLAGQPLVEVTLTTNFERVMFWLGLDMGRWEEGFEEKEDLYKWLTVVKDGGVLERAWEVVKREGLGRMKVDWKRFHTRVDGLPEFIAWLRLQPKAGPTNVQLAAKAAEEAMPAAGHDSDFDSSESKETPAFDREPSSDPENPTPLDPLAASLLRLYNKEAEYNDLVSTRQATARSIVNRQKQREANKIAAEQARLKAELRRKDEAAATAAANAANGESFPGSEERVDQASSGKGYMAGDEKGKVVSSCKIAGVQGQPNCVGSGMAEERDEAQGEPRDCEQGQEEAATEGEMGKEQVMLRMASREVVRV